MVMNTVITKVQKSLVGWKDWHMKVSLLEVQEGQIVIPSDGKKNGPQQLYFESVVPQPSVEALQVKNQSGVSRFLGNHEKMRIHSKAPLGLWNWLCGFNLKQMPNGHKCFVLLQPAGGSVKLNELVPWNCTEFKGIP